MNLQSLLQRCPIIPILNEINPDDILSVGEIFINAGFHCLEIPLSTQDALSGFEQLNRKFSGKALIGAGMVTGIEQIDIVKQLRGQVIMMPHVNAAIIQKAKEKGLYCLAGAITPTEALSAIEAGADALRLFPAPLPSFFKNLKKVLPVDTLVLPAGAIELEMLSNYWESGVTGFAIEINSFSSHYSMDEVNKKAKQLYSVMQGLT